MSDTYYVRFSYPHWNPDVTQRVHGWRKGICATDREAALEAFWSLTAYDPVIVTIDECTLEVTHYLPLGLSRVPCKFAGDGSRFPRTTGNYAYVTCDACIEALDKEAGGAAE